jgi:thiamine-monophosphate kinase
MITLTDIGEFGFIQRFSENFKKNLPDGFEGIGDDCAIMPYNNDEVFLITTDMLVEHQHFLPDKIKPVELGYKSLAVNLSDIAAMGGTPVSAFLSLGIRPNTSLDWLDDFFRGLKHLADESGTLLLGGDTAKVTSSSVVNIAVVGKCSKKNIKRRSEASSGDVIVVTGFLGDSGGGLKVIQDDLPVTLDTEHLTKRHHLPRPHIEEGMFLSSFPEVTAMLDISDGISSDIRHIMNSSGVGAKLEIDKLPLSTQLKNAGADHRWDLTGMALNSGEDYCLLATIKRDKYYALNTAFNEKFNRPLHAVGEITESGHLEYLIHGEKMRSTGSGFDHFQRSRK